MPHYLEVYKEMKPYRQRVIYEGNPELSFLHDERSDATDRVKEARRGSNRARRDSAQEEFPTFDTILDAEIPGVARRNLMDVAAMLATARRVFTKSAKRIPADASLGQRGSANGDRLLR